MTKPSLDPGKRFPDLDLPDHEGRRRRLADLPGGDPLVLCFSRGWWCPKKQRFLRALVELQDEFEVGYARILVVSVDEPEVQAPSGPGSGRASCSSPTPGDAGWGRSSSRRPPTPPTARTSRASSRFGPT